MADIADKAADHIERESIGLLARRKPIGPVANGRCHFCDEILNDTDRWCDANCRDDYQRDLKRSTPDTTD